MPQEYRPLAMFFGALSASEELSFNTLTGALRISNYVVETQCLLSLCDGKRSIQEIRSLCPSMRDEVFSMVLATCEEYSLVVDSRKVYDLAHQASLNSQFFRTDLSDSEIVSLQQERPERTIHSAPIVLQGSGRSAFETLLEKRRTTRALRNQPIAEGTLAGLLRATYGHKHYHGVPSAGALYPLSLYVIVNKGQCVPTGVYYYSSSEETIRLVTDEDLEVRTFEATANVGSIEPGVILVLTANLYRSGQKYSNRGYRYVLNEVGHAAQNAQLYSAENGLGITEYGGYNDETMSALLGINYPEVPLLCLFVGAPIEPNAEEPAAVLHELREKLIGPDKPLNSSSVVRLNAPGVGSCWWGSASYQSPSGEGLGFSSAETHTASSIRAISEAYERWASAQVRVDLVGTASKIRQPWLHPNTIEPLEPWQYQHYPRLARFRTTQPWEWVKGHQALTQQEVMVPIDLVFYPLSKKVVGRRPCRLANSSGVAAHLTSEAAQEKAFYELIERDAIMIAWMTRGLSQHFSIPREALPDHLQEAVKEWESKGRKLKFIDLRTDGPPVVLAVIYSDSFYPALSVGCAAGTSYNECCSKAYHEAELGIIVTTLNPPPAVEDPRAVRNVEDHSRFYNSAKQLQKLDWLLEAAERLPRSYDPNPITEDLMQQYAPVFVDLTPNGSSPLKVWRALSPLLVPMSFGYGTELISHPRLAMLKFKRQALPLGVPHFFS